MIGGHGVQVVAVWMPAEDVLVVAAADQPAADGCLSGSFGDGGEQCRQAGYAQVDFVESKSVPGHVVVCVVKAGHYGGPVEVDHLPGGNHVEGDNPVATDRHRASADAVDGDDAGVGQQKIRGAHRGTSRSSWSFATRSEGVRGRSSRNVQ